MLRRFTIAVVFAVAAFTVSAKRVVVLGANGRTGRIVVDLAAEKGYDVVACTRNGELKEPVDPRFAKKVTSRAADVSDLSSLRDLRSDAVFFCASASKEGGSPAQVDNQGLVNTAQACIEQGVPRLVVVSSGAVSKPLSPVYLFLNLFGGIMAAKAKGEEAVRTMYRTAPEKLGYTIVRPGGLTLEPPIGPEGIELNQCDEKSGRISRYDVAAVCLNSIDSPAASRVTIECYNKDTGKPLSSVFMSNLFRMKSDASTAGAYERRGSSWKEIFTGLVSDDKLV